MKDHESLAYLPGGVHETRRTIPLGIRFRVLERDGFTCQYCGRAAPDVRLHLDHVTPLAEGGDNDEENLVVACVDCNAGKAARHFIGPNQISLAVGAILQANDAVTDLVSALGPLQPALVPQASRIIRELWGALYEAAEALGAEDEMFALEEPA